MSEPLDLPNLESDSVRAYKRIFQEVLDRRPSGTRQRLAQALERNRSFITQISNPSYGVPIPAPHVAAILEICRFSSGERAAFLEAYRSAHPRSLVAVEDRPRGRQASLQLPDFGDDKKNAAFDVLLESFLTGVTKLMAETNKSGG